MALRTLTESVSHFVHALSHLPFEEIVRLYDMFEPCAPVENDVAYILYGGDAPFFVDSDGVIKIEVRGLIYEPRAPMML